MVKRNWMFFKRFRRYLKIPCIIIQGHWRAKSKSPTLPGRYHHLITHPPPVSENIDWDILQFHLKLLYNCQSFLKMTKFKSWALFNDFSNFIASIPLPGTKICAPKTVPKYVHNSYFIIKSGCCKQLILYETNISSDFYAGFSTFLGIWYQVYIPCWKSLQPNERKQGYRQEQ